MQEPGNDSNRRTFLKSAAIAAVGAAFSRFAEAQVEPASATSLFDGKTLNGWIQAQNSATAISGNDITDLADLAKRISGKSDPVAAFLSQQLEAPVKANLISSSAANTDEKTEKSALAKNLTTILSDPNLYQPGRFRDVHLRPETEALLKQHPQGRDLIHLNRMLLEDAFPADLAKAPSSGWTVKDGAIASTGAGRGVLYTAHDYGRFRLTFTMRHVSGNPDHQACVLIFCTRPQADEVPLDALAGIQFQVPLGGHWDYRPGHNNAGDEFFTRLVKPSYDPHDWSRVEIVADASTGTARMAVAQPVGSKAVEVLDFKDANAGKSGPLALQMHNAGLFDEYKDITVEANPTNFDLMTVK